MEILEIHPETPHRRTLNQVVDTLEKGGLVIYPTDTVYGMGCSLYQKKAIQKLYQIKEKSKFQSMTLICDSIQQVAQFTTLGNAEFRILKRCLPGPFTFILPAKKEIAKLMLSRRKEIGVRIPDIELCRQLVDMLGHPLLNTSVNGDYPGEPDAAIVESGLADILLDCGVLPEAGESTVVSLLEGEPVVEREGIGPVDLVWG
ncbi:MAG TPA: L-threonylcarbamoyladenylate synthase [Calditrichia bacterium]|nr:threonylcarbamoyl-AMP synthase [Calditrichota bacterium]HQU70991.1 L-threonylcarbamoyladenylate synthase [Calditrichia bacterium]HQV30433.1 L-threonylcarbamoyladenylate synthase [Calditrichia bacterium]